MGRTVRVGHTEFRNVLSTGPGGDLAGLELHKVAQRDRVLVTEGTWLQLMCCVPYRPQRPNFVGRGTSKDRVRREVSVAYLRMKGW